MLIHHFTEKTIYAGPQAVEAELGKMTGIANQNHSCRTKFQLYLEELQKTKQTHRNTAVLYFLIAYFHRKASIVEDNLTERDKHLEQALLNYRNFLRSSDKGNADMRYFAQWEIGTTQRQLGMPWPLIEEAYLKCLEYDLYRAEALQDVLVYRYTQKQWRIALIYSSYCMNHFLGKQPTNRYWNVDKPFYDWKILRYHIPILIVIRKKEEAKILLDRLTDCLRLEPEGFTKDDCVSIQNLKNRMEEDV